jgi:SMI1-KNR4 cell-wall
MSQSAVEKAIAALTEAGMASPGALKGCTPEEIGQIEARFHLQLPPIYKEFLARMGKAGGQFLVGSDYLFPALLHLREDAEVFLEESGVAFRLDPSDFVFVGHQGYEFLFFNVAVSSDPPVSLLVEDEQPKIVFAHFSEWLVSCVADEIEAFKALRPAVPKKPH